MEALLTKLSHALPIALDVLIIFWLIRRKLRRRFFWFLVYIVYELIESVLRLSVSGNRILYSKIYWWTEVGDVTFTVLAFRESFLNVFRKYTRLRWFVAVIWSLIGAALLYALFKALIVPPLQANRRGAIIISLEVAINFALGVVATLYFALISLLKIKGRRWESGIISGFTIYVALAISGFVIRSIFGMRFPIINAWIFAIGYILAELTWALHLSRPEPTVPVPTRELTIDDLTKLEQYSRTLERLLGKKP